MKKQNKQFTIAAYVAPPPPHEANHYDNNLMEAGYSLAGQAGFNTCYGYYEKMPKDRQYVLKALESAAKHDITYLIYDLNFSKSCNEFEKFQSYVEEYSKYSSFGGHQIWDEPGIKNFETIRYMKQKYRELFPDKLFYINLQPVYSPSYYLQNGMWTEKVDSNVKYETYLKEYIKIVQPEILSVDFYPMLVKGIHSDYYRQLSIIREASKMNNIPFWVYIQSCTWNASEARLPNGNELLWQINTSVAYGAVGIQYFCFFTPYSNSIENYNVALIDFYGQPTPLYGYAKRANLHIKSIQDKLLNMDHIGVIKNGNITAPVPKEDIIQIDDIKGMKGDILIGVFVGNGKKCFVVVCDSIAGSQQNIQIDFKNEISYSVIKDCKIQYYKSCCFTDMLCGGETVFIELNTI